MITGIPTSDDYKAIGIECLLQAYTNIYEVDTSKTMKNVPRREMWGYHAIVVRTSIVLVHQGIESLLKAKIAETTPLLLIDQKRGDWKTMPNSSEQNFSDLYTISGEDLIRTYYACIIPGSVSEEFQAHFETVRIARNRIVHGVGGKLLSPDEVLKLILWTFTYLFGQDGFWACFKAKFDNHPGHDANADEIEEVEAFLYDNLDYLEFVLSKRELNRHFIIDITKRRYFCPECVGGNIIKMGIDGPIEASKWAFLSPNEPTSTAVYCLSCDQTSEVKREDCNQIIKGKQCKGNVLYIENEAEETSLCLTCLGSQNE
ncbi:hypothetical protein [Runella sp.]|uniref:hypothetical protein n=1 Tax=Runella sp. TaxID=1960881 RepID=UPI003D0CF04F